MSVDRFGLLLLAFLTAALAVGGSYMLFGRFSHPTFWSPVMVGLMETTSPYARDREQIREGFKALDVALLTLDAITDEMYKAQITQREKIAEIEGSLDARQGWRADVTARLKRIEQLVRVPSRVEGP